MSYKRLTVLLCATQKGGAGKTTIADASHAVSTAAGLDTLVVDVDDGNSGFKRRSGKTAAVVLEWLIEPAEAQAWAERYLTGKDFVIFDLGANLLASLAPVTQFLGVLIPMLEKAGARIVFFAVASPNSPGTGRLVKTMRDDFGALGGVRLVENNVDGSGEFAASLATAGLKKIPFARIDPGIQAIRLRRVEPLLNVLRHPTPGYRLAIARYALFVRDFAMHENARDIFGEAALPELQSLAAAAPAPLVYALLKASHACDDAIALNVALCDAQSRLMATPLDDRGALAEAALLFIERNKQYRAI
ncbi:MAG TPA: hypothetical protein VFP12_00550 [Allosphingosinicella sp.]|nr:hypothetical protein [Allosphingosinicella sp.]